MKLYGQEVASRLLVGTALYSSPAVMEQAIRASGAEIVTVSLRREAGRGNAGNAFWSIVKGLDYASCRIRRAAAPYATP